MLLTLQGFWTVALYFGLLGIIWLPRYYVIPTKLRLWPSYWLYSTFSTNTLPPLSSAYDKRTYNSRNYSLNIDYKHECFTCQVNMKPKHCSSLMYSDAIFDSIHTSDSYDVYTYENYPCYQRLAKQGQCVVDNVNYNVVFSGAACTLCSICHKNTMFNTSHRTQYGKYYYTPRFSISLGNSKHGTKNILHCLNKLVQLRFYNKNQFCDELQQHLSVYKQDKTTVFTGCSSFCSDSSSVVHRELYSTELGVYLIMLAVIGLCIVGVIFCVGYVLSLYRELGILNLEWNSSQTCPICMDKLYRLTRISKLHCGHMFCRGCLNQWLHVFCHVTCPLCRQPVDPNAPPLSTRDNSPQLLMLSDTPHSESEEESIAGSENSHHSTLNSSIMQSIYNMGRNVVAGWSSQPASHNSSPFDLSRDSTTSLINEGERVDILNHSFDPGVAEALSATSISEPIPLPYYPLRYNTDHSNSVVVPYSTTALNSSPCSSNLLLPPPFFRPTPHTALFSGLSFHDNAQDSAHSDTELFGPSSRLQNRIARKINRLKNRRLGVRIRTRRAQSTSDLTSMTSQSESEVDVL
ncbi:uncharacterized protein LOC134822669 isoform X2 [Bolinopsis microptera]|uniref:uncharacterized protein LOC134822669 isoform X2 n=1 Tax=Bolinopsis microptera TaxID=2820187 RepID=UPI00307A9DE0